jgi:hypothetical protein
MAVSDYQLWKTINGYQLIDAAMLAENPILGEDNVKLLETFSSCSYEFAVQRMYSWVGGDPEIEDGFSSNRFPEPY